MRFMSKWKDICKLCRKKVCIWNTRFWMILKLEWRCSWKNPIGWSVVMDGLMISDTEVWTMFWVKIKTSISWYLIPKCTRTPVDRCLKPRRFQQVLNSLLRENEKVKKISGCWPCNMGTCMLLVFLWEPIITKLCRPLRKPKLTTVLQSFCVFPPVLIGVSLIWNRLPKLWKKQSNVVTGVYIDTTQLWLNPWLWIVKKFEVIFSNSWLNKEDLKN